MGPAQPSISLLRINLHEFPDPSPGDRLPSIQCAGLALLKSSIPPLQLLEPFASPPSAGVTPFSQLIRPKGFVIGIFK